MPRPTALPADAYPVMAALQGHLAGKWTNTTYSTNGTMAWDVSADSSARTVTIVVTITGNAFGMPAPAPERIELTHLAQGRIGGPSMAFGTVNGTITSTGHLQMTLTQLPVAMITKVDVSGMLTATSVTLNYTVTFSGGGTATGTVTMSK
ncbi:MAG: hypothetical protein JOY80_12560 [Candidatus Dormibacteraeota bacterium]|nr:hypothetical protein [Candidatus Dormibacteraeota bacterium]